VGIISFCMGKADSSALIRVYIFLLFLHCKVNETIRIIKLHWKVSTQNVFVLCFFLFFLWFSASATLNISFRSFPLWVLLSSPSGISPLPRRVCSLRLFLLACLLELILGAFFLITVEEGKSIYIFYFICLLPR